VRQVIRTQVDVVLPEGVAVLNADDPVVAELAELSDGEVIYYSTQADTAVLTNHRKQGRRAVYCRDGHVVLARGDQETQLLHLDLAPIAKRLKQDGLQLATLLATVATGWALDVPPLLIRAGLKNFGQKTSATSSHVARTPA
jgi:cyanophycin synthetase